MQVVLSSIAAVVPPFPPPLASASTSSPILLWRRVLASQKLVISSLWAATTITAKGRTALSVTSENNSRTLKRARSTNRCFQGRKQTVAPSFAALIARHPPRLLFTQTCAQLHHLTSVQDVKYICVFICLHLLRNRVKVYDKGQHIHP